MQIQNNKNIVSGFYIEVINKRNINSIGDYLTEDFIHNGVLRGITGQADAVKMFLNAFNPLENAIEFSLGEDNLVCVHEKWKGIHTGNFMGIKATGKNVHWTSTAVLQIRDGKICRAWDENDFLSLFSQIGSFPKI